MVRVRRLSFLLRPGWLGLVAGVLIFAGACFWILSPWQFGRNTERQTQLSALTDASSRAPQPLDKFLPTNAEPTAAAGVVPGHHVRPLPGQGRRGRAAARDRLVLGLRSEPRVRDPDPVPPGQRHERAGRPRLHPAGQLRPDPEVRASAVGPCDIDRTGAPGRADQRAQVAGVERTPRGLRHQREGRRQVGRGGDADRVRSR